ncbi:MAG: PPC domain-containing protein, partial [Cyanobacteria bacterium J06636_27]
MDQPNAVINLLGVSLEAEGAQDVTFMVEAGEGYEQSTTAGSSTVTVYDTIDQVPAPTSTPEVGLSISTDELREGRGAATLNFTVNGEIPAEGVVVYVNSGVRAGLGEFDIFNAGVSGGAFPAPDGNAGGFYFKINEPTASITLQAVDDDIEEGLESFTFMLEDGADYYTVAPNMASDSLIIADGRNSEIQVSLTGEPEVLVEADGTVSQHILSLSAPPPAEGITVRVSAPNVGEFDLNGVQFSSGVTLADNGVDENGVVYLDLTITEQTATVGLPVANDGVAEGMETAVFTLVEGEGYEINPEASGNSFTIVDTAAEVPAAPIIESRSNSIGDTIATATETGLSADNNSVTIEASINGNFFDPDLTQRTDNTEDVDMYSFELKAGDTVTIDIDSIPFEQGGFEVEGGADLRLFDAAGKQLVYSAADAGPDELFAVGRDAFIEYTAEADGTYYVGVSQAFNENYKPNEKGSGDGAILTSRGLGAGPYNLEIKLNPGIEVETFVEFDGEPNANAPVVTFNVAAGTFDDGSNILTSQIVESVAAEGRNSAALTLSFAVDGEIPEGGLEVIVKADDDFRDYFADVSSSPRTGAGGQIIGAVYNADGSPAGIKVLLTSANASFPLTISDRDADDDPSDDPNAPETVTFSLANSPDYAADSNANSTEVTFYDDLDQITDATTPEIGISIDKTELIESEGTEVNVTFNVTGDIPADGVLVYVDSGIRSSIGEFDVFNAEITGASFPTINNDAGGFYFRIFEDGANIKLNVFDETTNPEIPAEDALEGVEEFTFALQPGGDYTVKPDAPSVTFTIKDNPDSVPLSGNGGGGNGGGGGGNAGPTDNDGRTSNNDTIADAVDLGLSLSNLSVTVEGEIAQRFRGRGNTADASEDVDMYAFTLGEGQTIKIDVDAGGIGGVEGSLLDSFPSASKIRRTELANVGNAPAPDEVFQSNGDPYIEFTAPATGTYYAGISNLGNDFYNPNEANSGSGWTFDGRFEP